MNPDSSRTTLIVGGAGPIGSALAQMMKDRAWHALSTHRVPTEQGILMNLFDHHSIVEAISRTAPATIVLAIDGAARAAAFEREPESAEAFFVESARTVAGRARELGSKVVLLSSDLVFDGADGPYGEDAAPKPHTVFGKAKAAAEELVLSLGADGVVVRSSEIFGWNLASANLAMEVWRRAGSGCPVAVSRSWFVTPTASEVVARAVMAVIEASTVGVVHVTGAEQQSRFGFATQVADALGINKALILDRPEWLERQGADISFGLRSGRLETIQGWLGPPLKDSLRQFGSSTRRALRQTSDSERPEAVLLRQEIRDRVVRFHAVAHPVQTFLPLQSRVPYAGRVFGSEEVVSAVDAVLDFWLTLGVRGEQFEEALRDWFSASDAVFVNSGSTANLTAVLALTSRNFRNQLHPGDEVLTPAVTFPTTLAPIVHCGLIPVLVDCEIGTYNADPAALEDAISAKTRAMVLPHTLGNPCDMTSVMEIVHKHDLVLVEDSCDAFGARFDGRPVGTFGSLATLSFYPAHHITTGEGGAVIVNDHRLKRLVRSVRDWGRDCWCASGESNTCGRRFDWQLGDLPCGYDHKYIYSTLGYNFKPTDIQAAIGIVQLTRLADFLARRRHNFDRLYEGLVTFEQLIMPRSLPLAEPAWFGFPITVQDGTSRERLVQWLERRNVETRQVFAGNVLRQPAFQGIDRRVPAPLTNSDRVMRDTFFIGVYPGLTDEKIDFVLEQFDDFFSGAIS